MPGDQQLEDGSVTTTNRRTLLAGPATPLLHVHSIPDRGDSSRTRSEGRDWLRATTGLPVVVKGVLRADDALECVAAGASAVWVSNHGGRQLDGAVATALALPPITDALTGTGAEVYVDGGIRNGRHVLSALALGATAVFVGRPTLWALTVGGAAAVQRLITDLTAELAHAMALAGVPNIACVTSDLVCD
jgi:4-hydroxymandelate oxidase